MTANDFEEIVLTLIMTYDINKTYIAKILKVKPRVISQWLKTGVPMRKTPMISFRLRRFVRERGKV